MRQIYSIASRIVVYLGEEAKRGDVAMDTLASQEGKDIEIIGPKVEGPLHALLTRPYFFRTWVIQEVAMAYKATVTWGDRTIAWAALEHALQSKSLKPPSEAPVWMGQAWKSGLDSESTDSRLMQLLENTLSCLAGDPRDKIFGILALVGDKAAGEGIVPDYSLSVQQVYTGVAAYLLENSERESIIRYAMMGPKQIPNLPSWVPDWTSIHSASKTGSEEPETVVIHIKSGVESISPWYTVSLGEPLEENELEIVDRDYSNDEASMLEHGERIWGADFPAYIVDWCDGERDMRFFSKTGSLGVWSSLLFWVDQEGRLHSGQPRELTTRALRGDILYQGGDAPRLDEEKEVHFIPALGGVFLAKRHRMENTASLIGKCSLRILAARKSLEVTRYKLDQHRPSRLNGFEPADKKWYILQLRTMCAELYRILSWQNTMNFLTLRRRESAGSGNVRHTSSSALGETPPAREADNNLRKLQHMWEEAVAKIRLDAQFVKESPDLDERCPANRFTELSSSELRTLTVEDAWEIECLRAEDETLASCSEHISALHERLIPSLTFARLVDYVYHFDNFLCKNVFWEVANGGDPDGWKWKSWVLMKEVLPVLRRLFLDESDLGSLELTRIRLWEQIATLHLIVDLQASSAATGMQLNTWAARTHMGKTIIV
jgi:hypothetical protein